MNSKSSSVCVEGQLVNEDCKREPVCLKCSEGLVTVNSKSSSVCVEGEFVNKDCKREPVRLKCIGGLVKVSNWALGAVALVAFKPSGDVA